MVQLGDYNLLRVTKQVDFGVYLDGGSLGEILLPKRYVPVALQPNQRVEVFLYLDSEDRLIATTEKPLAKVGECAYLKAVDTNRHGAFLDWGLAKDLLVPHNEQEVPMQVGESYVVYVYIDERSETIIGSSRLAHHLSELGYDFTVGQSVNLLTYARSDLGYKVVINNSHLGLLFHTEIFQPIQLGQSLTGYIKQVRPDRKIDLTLQAPGTVVDDAVAEQILTHLRARGGSSDFTDKSPPEKIYQEFKVSKAHFKRALGSLYKQKRILLTKDKIILIS